MSLLQTLSRTVAVLVPGTKQRPSYDTTVRVQGTSQRLDGSLWRHRLGSRGRPGVTRRSACMSRAPVSSSGQSDRSRPSSSRALSRYASRAAQSVYSSHLQTARSYANFTSSPTSVMVALYSSIFRLFSS